MEEADPKKAISLMHLLPGGVALVLPISQITGYCVCDCQWRQVLPRETDTPTSDPLKGAPMASHTNSTSRASGISAGLTLLFALVGGVGVGSLYWAQPLLGDIAAELGVSPGTAGLLVTLSQVGYALGVFLVVPLGDTVNRRRLIPIFMFLCSLSLGACVLAPNFAVLLTALALVGFANVAGQLLLPLAGDLATDEQRGRAVATIASGLLIGILLSRLVSGIIADIFGWRIVYVAASAVVLFLAALMCRAVPTLAPRDRIPYGALLRSVLESVVRHRPVRIIAVFVSRPYWCSFRQ